MREIIRALLLILPTIKVFLTLVAIAEMFDWDQFCGVLAVVITACYGIARLHARLTNNA